MSIIYGKNGILHIIDENGNMKRTMPFNSFKSDMRIEDSNLKVLRRERNFGEVVVNITLNVGPFLSALRKLSSSADGRKYLRRTFRIQHRTIMTKKIRKYARSIQ